jgi:uncharacterized protein YjbJ (UPF0337 family)
MNADTLKGQWKQLKGNIRKQWGKLTDDDFEQIKGDRDIFLGKLQERYGYSKDVARRELDEWLARQEETRQEDRP